MSWELPTTVEIDGVQMEINSDYRAVLDICTALVDPEFNDTEKITAVLEIFYKEPEHLPHGSVQEAVNKCFWFIEGGKSHKKSRKPRLVDWAQDFPLIVAPVNRVAGTEIRSVPYLHWWTFLAAYGEIGDCTFAQVVNIRRKKAMGKPLDRSEREWYKHNIDIVELKHKYTDAEDDLVNMWTKGAKA